MARLFYIYVNAFLDEAKFYLRVAYKEAKADGHQANFAEILSKSSLMSARRDSIWLFISASRS